MATEDVTRTGGGPPVRGSPESAAVGQGVPWHSLSSLAVASELGVSLSGIDGSEAEERVHRFGPNRLDPPAPPSALLILLRQFRNPLIYVLLGAASLALGLGELADAGFIVAVLLLNALIGFANEIHAERQVRALSGLIQTRSRVHRGGRAVDVDSELIVPGDLLLLESGCRVGGDVRLIEAHALRVDESLLTGESMPVEKDAASMLSPTAPLAERCNMAFAGSLVASGRGVGLVVGTGARTEVGKIAGQLASVPHELPPLIRRMERFARVVGLSAVGLCVATVAIGLLRGQPLTELLFAAVALAVSAIPEGLPVAVTVALAVAVSRMATRAVVVRHLPAVEALGSCGVIATDKTGTLTRNELTVERVVGGSVVAHVTGVGYAPEGSVFRDRVPLILQEHPRVFRTIRAVCLANEASLTQRPGAAPEWEWSGDPTDVAMLSLGLKCGCDPVTLAEVHPLLSAIPFEPELRYAASFHQRNGGGLVCVKGAPEQVLEMCTAELGEDEATLRAVDHAAAFRAVEELMREGYRVLAVADAETPQPVSSHAPAPCPSELVFLGLVAMTDPPRVGVPEAVAACTRAGVHVAMITGDHATTARAIAERIGLATPAEPVLTGREIVQLEDDVLGERISGCTTIARATPTDKLRVVRAWQRSGALVAVTGDGVNDAPALRQADLGVAMGRQGTDVAREAAALVITDDNFVSIVAGIEEGRIAYDNVRKVTYLLISTGVGEVLVVLGALAAGLPIPFTAVQLLWLNLVTNGIQDVALAFEPGEPGVMERPPRPPRQRIIDRVMIERTVLAGALFGILGLASWAWLVLDDRPVAEARNYLVQLFVLFEIFHIGNSRSETRSLFALSPLDNPVLLAGTLGAIAVHLAATYTPFFQELLGVSPLTLPEWGALVALAATIVVVMETHKWFRGRHAPTVVAVASH